MIGGISILRTTTIARLVGVSALAFILSLLAPAPKAHADDPAFLSIGTGTFDWNRRKDEGVEFRMEYRSNYKIGGIFKPFVAVAGTNTGNYFAGAGVLVDLYVGKRFVITPSFAPHYYTGGNKKLDLDYPLEFRSQIEFAYRFDNRSRLGIAVSHYSNASLGKTNPGTEAATLYYSMPIDTFLGN